MAFESGGLTSCRSPVNFALFVFVLGGRTGFDWVILRGTACRGWYVGLVNHRTKNIIANEELALAA